jgi:hypothetical protein
MLNNASPKSTEQASGVLGRKCAYDQPSARYQLGGELRRSQSVSASLELDKIAGEHNSAPRFSLLNVAVWHGCHLHASAG